MKPSLSEQLANFSRERPLYDPAYENVPPELFALRNDYQEIIEQKTGWEACGPMWRVVDHRVTELVEPTIQAWVPLATVQAEIIWHQQKWQVGVTGVAEGYGELWPHGEGRFTSIRKPQRPT